jgi:hypothetical protein
VPPKTGRNRLHLEIAPPDDGEPRAEVARLVSLGASRVASGPGDGSRVLMVDPDGNEFCLVSP